MGMDSSIAQHHHQEMNCSSSSQTLESMLAGTKSAAQQQENKKPRPADMDSLKCPRCDSTNTKFCYYNNYSLSQPRYFCKSCRRYWTKGGTLRNVPVGGGCRKNKRPSSASSSCSSASSRQRSQDNHHPIVVGPTASIPSSNDDLNLAIARLQRQDNINHDFSIWGNPNMPYHHMHDHSLIRSEFLETPLNGIPSFQYENIGIGMGMGLEMGNPYDEFNTTSMAVKEEGENSKVLFGFPWHNAGGNSNSNSNSNTGEFDSGARLSWNGINNGSSYNNWHGLLNSPLM